MNRATFVVDVKDGSRHTFVADVIGWKKSASMYWEIRHELVTQLPSLQLWLLSASCRSLAFLACRNSRDLHSFFASVYDHSRLRK
jgi:hypothetical protein